MVQPAEHERRNELAEVFYGTRRRRVSIERLVGPIVVVVLDVPSPSVAGVSPPSD